MSILIEFANVTRLEPPIGRDVLRCLLWVVVIARRDVGSVDPYFALIVLGEIAGLGEIDEFDLSTAWNVAEGVVCPF